MENKEKLRAYIKEMLKKTLEEMSTTAGAGPFLTPHAFRGSGPDAVSYTKKLSNKTGYELTARGQKDAERPADRLEIIKKKLAENRYYELKNNPEKPHKKIAGAISELNRSLKEVNRILGYSARLQLESGIASDQLWERTKKGLIRLESNLIRAASRIREIRGQ